MRVFAVKAAILATTVLIATAALGAAPALAGGTKAACACDCPDDHKVKAMPRPAAPMRRPARAVYGYRYGQAVPVSLRGWHGAWRVAPDDGMVPGYGPPPGYYGPPPQDYGIHIDDRGFVGGVAYGASGVGYGGSGVGDGGGGGAGFADDFGQVHFAQGGNAENGPTYNSYGQSFQYNPSVAGPFQSRLMGGLAPPPSSSSK